MKLGPKKYICIYQPERVQLLVFAAADAHGGGVERAQRRPHPETPLRRQAFPAPPAEEGIEVYRKSIGRSSSRRQKGAWLAELRLYVI